MGLWDLKARLCGNVILFSKILLVALRNKGTAPSVGLLGRGSLAVWIWSPLTILQGSPGTARQPFVHTPPCSPPRPPFPDKVPAPADPGDLGSTQGCSQADQGYGGEAHTVPAPWGALDP